MENNFAERREAMISRQGSNTDLRNASNDWFRLANASQYSYNFEFFGRPIIQYPQDIVQLQELLFRVKPDLIIETGIAHGGSLCLSASILTLLDVADGIDPRLSSRKVLGIDIDVREPNRLLLDAHPLRFKMKLIEGSSTSEFVSRQVFDIAAEYKNVFVVLDSNHTHSHVLSELNLYGPLVSIGSYCVVFDTVIENLPLGSFPDRPWEVGDNPMSAVTTWLKTHPEFEIDRQIDDKLLISVAPNGYLRRTR